jgi:hypothetical protein
MFDLDTFLTTLYVMADDFCREHLQPEPTLPGPAPALSRGEVITLAVFGQFARFASERDFWRFARQRLLGLFPTLPNRAQFNLLQRRHAPALTAFGLHLARQTQVDLSRLWRTPS